MNNNQHLHQLEQTVSAQLKEGDLLFISINAFLYKQVAKCTGSWSSHVGFAIKENDEWLIVESAVPVVTKTPLRKFLARTCNGELMVRRLKQSITKEDVQALKRAAHKPWARCTTWDSNSNPGDSFVPSLSMRSIRKLWGSSWVKYKPLNNYLKKTLRPVLTSGVAGIWDSFHGNAKP